MRDLIINSKQFLLMYWRCREGQPVQIESSFLGQTKTEIQIFDDIGDSDHVTRLIRFDTETLISEDITEQLAHKWLVHADASDGIREEVMPRFVKDSRAWSVWKDDLEAEAPVAREPDVFQFRPGMPLDFTNGAVRSA